MSYVLAFSILSGIASAAAFAAGGVWCWLIALVNGFVCYCIGQRQGSESVFRLMKDQQQ